ncbi:MAG TPA: DoxX family protein [Gemmatimonadales bacterium]|nr:DoxX family protein [Gemmatimonadales bacterium]
MRWLVRTTDDPVALLLRLALALVIFPHGAQKALGWWGGPGLQGAIGFLHGPAGLPLPIAWLVVAIEFLGPILLFIGLLGRLGALGILFVMIGAVLTTHLPNGFFMNWSGQQQGEGFEFHILAAALCLAILIRGSGLWSADRAITRRMDMNPYGPRTY